jgi:hypothetical protein
VSLSWYKAPIRGLRPDSYFRTECGIRLTVTFLIPWGALSDERTGLSFVCAAGPCQRNLSRVLVPWDLWPYFTVSDLRLPLSSPSTTRRVTVEVFDPASTRVIDSFLHHLYIVSMRTYKKRILYCWQNLFTAPLSNNRCPIFRRVWFYGNVFSDPCLAMGMARTT